MAEKARQLGFLKALVRFGQSVEDRQELERLLQRAIVLGVRALKVTHGKVMRYRADRGDLVVVAGVGWKTGVVGHLSISTDSGSPAGRALQTAQPVVVEHLPTSETFRYPPVLEEHGILSALNVPILLDGEVWGVFEADSLEERNFNEEEVEFLQAMSFLVARPIRRDRMNDRLNGLQEELARTESKYQTALREVDHRVKNNLQVIHSVLALEQRRAKDADARLSFQNAMDKVTAVALAHDQLSVLQQGDELNLQDYLGALCAALGREYAERITITMNLEPVRVTISRAVPLGLIVNEAICNAAKHAYGEERGPVELRLTCDPELQEGCIQISDQGRGVQDNPKGGSGTSLMAALARQTGATVDRVSSPQGVTVTVVFPLAA